MFCWIDDIVRTPGLSNSFPRSLLINFDQTGVHLVPKSSRTFAAHTARHESIDSIGEDDKRQITAVVASSADGDFKLLPLQLIFQGKTQRCEAKPTSETAAANFHITHSPNHWSNLETMKQYMQKIIEPYIQQKITQHSLPKQSKAIVVLDCWSVHVSEEFLAYVKAQHKNITLVFIPPNCTGKLQVADTHLNFPFKCGIRFRFNNFVVEEMVKQIDNSDIEIDLKMSTLKPLVLQWCYESWNSMKAKKEFLMHAWEKLFALFDPLSKENQDIAVRESAKDQWKLAVKYDKEDDGEEDEDEYASESDDDEKDELNIMQEIRIGTRRSARVQHQRASGNQRKITGFMIRSDQVESDDEE